MSLHQTPKRWRSGELASHFLGGLFLQCYRGLRALLGHTSGRTSAPWDVEKDLKQRCCCHLHEPFKSHSESQFWALWKKKNCWWERKDSLRKRSKQIQKELSRYSKGLICQHFLCPSSHSLWRSQQESLESLGDCPNYPPLPEATAWCWEQDSKVTENLV